MMETIRFRNDTQTRRRLMVPDSFAHPAKGQLGMWATMIERYSQPGDTILDPMAGSGATLLAALMGRNVICVELEQHFVDPMRHSWEKMRTMPMLGYTMGQAVILSGDARCLPLNSADAVITSPPYEGALAEGKDGIEWQKKLRNGHKRSARDQARGLRTPVSEYHGYTRPQVDAIVTSPPYEGSEVAQSFDSEANHLVRDAIKSGKPFPKGDLLKFAGLDKNYAQGENIGNLRSDAYWSAMRQVYAECWRVLKPGGIMALVLKGFTRDGQYVDLPQQTAEMVQALGFVPFDHWRRELWSLSFWRILQKRRDPAAWDERLMYEEILAFQKPCVA